MFGRKTSNERITRAYAVSKTAEAIKREQTKATFEGKRSFDPVADHDAAYAMAEQVTPKKRRR